jgi:hypothetical protein
MKTNIPYMLSLFKRVISCEKEANARTNMIIEASDSCLHARHRKSCDYMHASHFPWSTLASSHWKSHLPRCVPSVRRAEIQLWTVACQYDIIMGLLFMTASVVRMRRKRKRAAAPKRRQSRQLPLSANAGAQHFAMYSIYLWGGPAESMHTAHYCAVLMRGDACTIWLHLQQ